MLNRQRARQAIAGPLAQRPGRRKNGENAIPARPTDNPLISLETAKEKSLEILGKVWGSLERLGESSGARHGEDPERSEGDEAIHAAAGPWIATLAMTAPVRFG